MSQPRRVAKDAARGELWAAITTCLASKLWLLRTPSAAAPARQSFAGRHPWLLQHSLHAREAPSPQREQYEKTRSPISSNRRPFTRTTAWADLPEKAEAKGAAAAVDLAAAEMAGDAAGAVRARVER